MYRIYRIIGKKGRITIPYEMRSALNIGRGDILSFQLNGKSVIITKEKLCGNCRGDKEALTQAVNSLEDRENVKRHVKHKKRENPKKAVKKQNTPYKLRIYGVYEV